MAALILILLWALIGFSGWRVFKRAGFHGWLGLLFLIPLVNFAALLYLAHKEWPAAK